ncbi:MAG TPA: exodeoxyribonuclease VII large subunit, partial [Pseudothermotoga sp.]
MEKIYTVSEVNYYIENLINDDPYLTDIQIVGEVVDCKERNGHLFFSLKDEFTTIGCVFFGAALRGVNLTDGQTVHAYGDVRVYPPRGVYRFQCKQLKILPQRGLLFMKMREVYEKLQKEGIFEKPKRSLPKYPRRIGIITSRSSAAYQDVLRTISERYPFVEILLYHTGVQGEDAKISLIKALKDANSEDLDVVLITRGGGSADDLWIFNDEEVVRAVYKLRHPVISGIGHQIDTVLIDLVADYSAHTPTAAAQAAVPEKSQVLSYAITLMQKMNIHMEQKIKTNLILAQNTGKRLLKSMVDKISEKTNSLQIMSKNLTTFMQRHI